jgi:excisionase family DNA binding protein
LTASTQAPTSPIGEAEQPTTDQRKPVPYTGGWDLIMEQELLSVEEAALVLGTGGRFPRRLITERRIRFVRVGRHVRIPRSALDEFIAAGTVEPINFGRAS